jgi:EthD domain-containing protein
VHKHLVTLRAPVGAERGAWARTLAAAADARYRWYSVDVAAETDALLTRGRREGRPQPFDALLTIWTGDDVPDLLWLTDVAEVTTVVSVSETVHWDDAGDEDAVVGAGVVKQVAFTAPRADLDLDEFAARYREHAAVARQHHPGVRRYVQNFVMRSSDNRSCAAVAELWFDDEETYRTRFYRDESSPEIVAADVARFLNREGTRSVIVWELTARRYS